MSLDVWFKDDIRNTLRALDATSAVTTFRMATNSRDAAYRQGYADAMRAVALAFGIETRNTHGETEIVVRSVP